MQWHATFTPIQAEYYLHDKLKEKNVWQVSNRLNEIIDTTTALYDSKEPMAPDISCSKTNDGWREENMISTPEQTGN